MHPCSMQKLFDRSVHFLKSQHFIPDSFAKVPLPIQKTSKALSHSMTSYRSYPCVPCLNSHSSLLVAVKVLQASQIPSDVARKFVKPWSAELWKNLSYLWWIFQIWGGCLDYRLREIIGIAISWFNASSLSLIEKKDCGKCTWQSFTAAAFGAVAVARGGSWQKESLHSLGRECNQLIQGYGLPNSRYIQHPRYSDIPSPKFNTAPSPFMLSRDLFGLCHWCLFLRQVWILYNGELGELGWFDQVVRFPSK